MSLLYSSVYYFLRLALAMLATVLVFPMQFVQGSITLVSTVLYVACVNVDLFLHDNVAYTLEHAGITFSHECSKKERC